MSAAFSFGSQMIELLLVGIGTGNPEHLTLQAIRALNSADLILIPRKGADKADLADLRRSICAEVVTNPATRIVEFDLPRRDRTNADYRRGVDDWHDAIAKVWSEYDQVRTFWRRFGGAAGLGRSGALRQHAAHRFAPETCTERQGDPGHHLDPCADRIACDSPQRNRRAISCHHRTTAARRRLARRCRYAGGDARWRLRLPAPRSRRRHDLVGRLCRHAPGDHSCRPACARQVRES